MAAEGTCGGRSKRCVLSAHRARAYCRNRLWSFAAGLLLLAAPGEALEIRRVPLGINDCGLHDWGTGQICVDLMKQARPFGTVDQYWMGNARIDENGWPLTDAGTIFAENDGNGVISLGTYKLSFTGRADIRFHDGNIRVSNVAYNASTNTTTADVTVSAGVGRISAEFTNTSGGIKNLRLIRPGYPTDGSKVVIDEFIEAIRPFSVFRTLGWEAPNWYINFTSWNQRRDENYATYGDAEAFTAKQGGPSYEFMIAIANQADKDLWFCLPTRADDDFIRSLAELIRARMKPYLRVYFEMSNELWNYAYPYNQTSSYNRDAAVAEAAQYGYTGSAYDMAAQRCARITVHWAGIFKQVLGDSAVPRRIRPVLSWQSGSGVQGDMLAYIQRRFGAGAVAANIYGIASAPYMHGESLDALRSWSDNTNRPNNAQLIAAARQYGVQPLTYEGGQHMTSGGQADVNRSQAMADLIYHDIKNNWYGQNGGLYCFFNLASRYDQWGYWGATENLGNLNTPKYQTLLRLVSELPAEVTVIPDVAVNPARVRALPRAACAPAQPVHYSLRGQRITADGRQAGRAPGVIVTADQHGGAALEADIPSAMRRP